MYLIKVQEYFLLKDRTDNKKTIINISKICGKK